MSTATGLDQVKAPQPVDVDKAADDDLQLWSVTTLIDVLSKPGLDIWKQRQGPTFACEEYQQHGTEAPWISRLEREGIQEAVAYITKFRWPADELTSAELGSVVHAACEKYALDGQRPTDSDLTQMIRDAQTKPQGKRWPKEIISGDAVASEVVLANRMLDQFDGWLQRFQPEYLAAEMTVYSPTLGYAGTLDAILRIQGLPLIGDYKSSREPYDGRGNPKRPYGEAGLQLAGYRHAELAAAVRAPRRTEYQRRRYYLVNEVERELAVPVPEVEGGVVLMITPEQCEAYPVRCDESVFRSFRYLIGIARWHLQGAQDAVGDPLVPPARDRSAQEVPA